MPSLDVEKRKVVSFMHELAEYIFFKGPNNLDTKVSFLKKHCGSTSNGGIGERCNCYQSQLLLLLYN
jgi:hypothetical protein